MSEYIEDPNEQLGKLINGGFYFQDKWMKDYIIIYVLYVLLI